MPIARFEMPDGRIGRFEVPEGTTPEQAQALISAEFQPEQPDVGMDAAQNTNEGPGIVDDVINSVAYRGLPEAVLASTRAGLALNVVRGISDATRWAGGKIYKTATGEELPHYTQNPIPSSSDVLQSASEKLIGKKLYDPQTTAGQYANTISQFGAGGKIFGAPLRATIPTAVASETAGQATAGTDWEIPARLASALVVGNISLNRSQRQPLKTAAEVRTGATKLFQQAEREGAHIPATATNQFIDDASRLLPQTEAGRLVLGKNSASELVERIQGLKDKPLTLTAAQEIDSGLGRLISKEIDPRTGKLNVEGQQIYSIQQKLRDSIDQLPEQPGLKTLKQAKAEWSKQARMSDIERIIERANNMDNPATGLRTGFRTLIHDKKRFEQFNKQEKAAIRHAARHGVLTGALRVVGSRLISAAVGMTAGAMGGGPLGAVGGAAAGGLAAFPARQVATGRQLNRANKVLETIANRGAPTPENALLKLLQQDSGIQFKPRIRVPAGGIELPLEELRNQMNNLRR